MKATSFSSSISANLGNSGEAMVEIHKYSVKVFSIYILKLSYFLHKNQMKATKNSQAYTVGTHGCV